ncbi:excalibur calcium-binding domain-containing protein [Streptomyces cylindrosporus]|uniref:Excalibur calcium-binding domain-containing protein n=1 Tax=Streptomyces cylindrosporus TaxID=2927583 RepID=A0ABS9YQP9_9ACTN|nr:excalibur calcium-binding domain-containing protein [Streptomyces cylindrosporus]MCI3278281.1 excalibur calcium-binding domain-containing protein [Streptomyces cylindrosporus]
MIEFTVPEGTPMNIGIRALSGTAVAILLTTGPAAVAAHAKADLDCNNFTYQEDAQAVFNSLPGDPYRLDEDNDGIACEWLRHRSSTTSTASPTTAPLRGVNAGLGGSTGPAGFEVVGGVGLTVVGLGLAAGHLMLRRRRLRRR